MNLIKKFAVFSAAVAAVALFAGCNKKTYKVYTNIPEEKFKILDKSFETGGILEGGPNFETAPLEIDTSGYTTKSRIYFCMLSDAELVVSDNFSKDGAEEKFTNFYKAVGDTLNRIDKAISSTVKDTDIYKFNEAAAGATLEISKTAYEVVSEALSVNELTGGYYNPALYYNIQAYGFGGAQNYPENKDELPEDGIIEKYTALASHFNEIELKEEEGKYFITKPQYTVEVSGVTLSLKLDLGGIGKGYAVDKVDGLFDEYGYNFGYFNFGASSMLVKRNLGQNVYNVNFSSPRSPTRDAYLSTEIACKKLSTSGDNEQFYNIDGKRYCHIINAFTGKPVDGGIMSVTVVGGSAASADAITTAIMAMDKDTAVEFVKTKLTDRLVAFTCE